MYQEDVMRRIRTFLARFQAEVEIDNSNGEFSINIHAENVLLKVLNAAYGLNLENVNYVEGKTYAGIDLRDKANRVAFQITSTGTVEKVVHTLKECAKKHLDEQFDYLYIFFLKGMDKNVKIDNSRIKKELGAFKPDNVHFLDHSALYMHLNKLNDIEKMEDICRLLEVQFADRAYSIEKIPSAQGDSNRAYFERVHDRKMKEGSPFKDYQDYVMRLYTKRNKGNELLGEESLSDLYMKPYYYTSENNCNDVEDMLENFSTTGKSGVLWIVGEPGHGKTSMCIKAVADYVNERKYQSLSGVFWFRLNPQGISEMVTDHQLTLKQVFSWGAIEGDRSEKIKPSDIKGSLVLLDGFDELKASLDKHGISNNQFYMQVNQLANSYNLHIVVTSRIRALEQEENCSEKDLKDGSGTIICRYRDGSSDKNRVWLLASLSSKQQLDWIDRLIKYRKDNQMDTEGLEKYRQTFLSLQDNKEVTGILEIPILLRMVVQNCFEPVLGNRVLLYRDLFDKTLLRQGIEDQQETLHKIYQEIAYKIFVYDDDSAEISKGEFTDLIDNEAYLYQYYLHTPEVENQKSDSDLYRVTFLHRSFYQYFLSAFIYDKFAGVRDELSGEEVLRYLWPRCLDSYVLENLQLLAKNENIEEKWIFKAIDKTDCILPDYANSSDAKENVGNFDKANNTFFNIISAINYIFQNELSQKRMKLTKRTSELLTRYNCNAISLSRVIIEKADLRSADLSYADLRSVDLSSADLRSAYLSSADLSSADLSSADLSSADLRSAGLRSADLSYADLRSADLRSADLSSANLRYADLSYADLSSADLSSAGLRSADLSYADLSSAGLSSAYLRSAYLSYADLSSADLSSADLSSAYLSSADLSSADLSSANLRSADLRRSRLNETVMVAANVEYAKVTKKEYDYIVNQDVLNIDKIIIVQEEDH